MDTENLINNIREYFLSQYKQNNQNSKTFIAFEPLGTFILPAAFKSNGVFDAMIGDQQLSLLTDDIPKISEVWNTEGFGISGEIYKSLIENLSYTRDHIVAGVDDRPYLEKFSRLKSRAIELLRNEPAASIIPDAPVLESATDTVYSCKGTPVGWYDSNSNIWSSHTFKQTDTQSRTTSTQPSSTSINSGKNNTANLVWKLNPLTDIALKNKNFQKAISNPVFLAKANFAKFHHESLINNVLINNLPPTTLKKISVPSPVSTIKLPSKDVVAINTAFIKSKSMPVINRQFYTEIRNTMPFNQMVKVNRAIGNTNTVETKEVKSTNFVFEFSYVLIKIERSWLYSEIFEEANAKLWYAVGEKAGSYSTGENAPSNNGRLRALAKAMIVVKDLKITANWTEEDRKSQSSSIGLGSFNTSSSSFDSTNKSLLQPGIQILGYICEVLPRMPFNDDKNIL